MSKERWDKNIDSHKGNVAKPEVFSVEIGPYTTGFSHRKLQGREHEGQ